MKSEHQSNQDEIWEELYPRILVLVKKNKWTWQSVGAVFGLGGGVFSIVAALVLPFASSAASGSVPFLEKISFVFLALFLPLLLFGAHCLDLLERKSGNLPVKELSLNLKKMKSAEFNF